MAEYKCILVKNNTAESRVTLFIYSKNDPVCFLSTSSKMLMPGEAYLHRSADGFKFRLRSCFDKKMKTVVDVREWTKDTFIAITNNEDVKESDLTDHEFETTVCIRKLNIEASTDKGRDLYRILELNSEDVRKLEKGKQDEVIKKAFHKQIRRWHTDIVGTLGDIGMAHEVIVAYDILRDPERRADYHNSVDYSKGVLSKAKWNSILFTECATTEQKCRYKERLAMMAISIGAIYGGVLLTVMTAGIASPTVLAVCGTFGKGCVGGGVRSLSRIMKRESIEEGCDCKNYVKSFALGFVAGSIHGGASILSKGTTGRSVVQAARLTCKQQIGMAVASEASVAATSSLAVDAKKKFVDGVDLTRKQVLSNVAWGVVKSTAKVGAKTVFGTLPCIAAEVTSTNMDK